MAAVVDRVHGVAVGGERQPDVLVAATVLAGAVGEGDDGPRLAVRQPGPPEDR